MIITKVKISNFKCFEDFELDLFEDVNVIVGDNETGKSTILEAINLALTGELNGKRIFYELTPYLFNSQVIKRFLEELQENAQVKPAPPKIEIELFFKPDDAIAVFQGTHNSLRENVPGLRFTISINDDEFADEYGEYIRDTTNLTTIPIEYYKFDWLTFAGEPISPSRIPLNASLIDASNVKHDKGADGFVASLVKKLLSPKESAELRLKHRQLKESFEAQETVAAINQKLQALTSEISDKSFSYSVDTSAKASWESGLSTYLDDLPFHQVGKGEQTAIKTRLALHRDGGADPCLVLIEEPENHLSFSNMNKLIKKVREMCEGKQLIISTHSSYVLNKLGLGRLIMVFKNKRKATLRDLSPATQDYFFKLPGYDTLRVLLSHNPILVEGPSDELIVQKAYIRQHGCLPIENGIDVISISGLAFKRFCEIAKLLQLPIRIVTDNDGDVQRLTDKYAEFAGDPYIRLFFDTDEDYKTLEAQVVKANRVDLVPLQRALNTIDGEGALLSESELISLMTRPSKKTAFALMLFDSNENYELPQYIKDAVQ